MPTKIFYVKDDDTAVKKYSLQKLIFYYDEVNVIPRLSIQVESNDLKLSIINEIGMRQTIIESDGQGKTNFIIQEDQPEIILEGNIVNAIKILKMIALISPELEQQISTDEELVFFLKNNTAFELPENDDTSLEIKQDSPIERLVKELKSGGTETVKQWLTDGNTPNTIFKGEPLLFIAVEYGQKEIVDLLILFKADLELTYDGTVPPLLEAIERNHLGIVRSLVSAKANIKATAANKNSVLIFACNNNWEHPELVSYLIEQNADVNCRYNNDGMTPLMIAVKLNHLDTMDCLLRCSETKLEQESHYYQTELMVAIDRNRPLAAHKLLLAGVNVDTVTRNGKTAMMLAENKKKSEMITLLKNWKDAPLRYSVMKEAVPTFFDDLFQIILDYETGYKIPRENSPEAKDSKEKKVSKETVKVTGSSSLFKPNQSKVEADISMNSSKNESNNYTS